MNDVILIDTHAHYYKFCEQAEFFDSAYSNMEKAACGISANAVSFIICLLETETSQWYQDLSAVGESSAAVGSWIIKSIDGNQALELSRNEDEALLVLPGRQVITRENLEVIIIGMQDVTPKKKSIEFYINEYSALNLVILPWGVGKWLGARGEIINEVLSRNHNLPFALGDNSGRTNLWSRVPQFRLAEQLGINILPGSDPLPISGQHKKVAKYGKVIEGKIEGKGILDQIRKKLLKKQNNQLSTYGELDGPFRFSLNQLLLRINPIR